MLAISPNTSTLSTIRPGGNISLSRLIRKAAQEAVEAPFRIKSLGKIKEEKFDVGDIFVVDVTKNNSAPLDQLIITSDGKQWLPCIYTGESKIKGNESLGLFHNFQAVYQIQDRTKSPALSGYSIPVNRESPMWKNIFRVL